MVVWDYDDRPVYGECKGAATELNGRTGVITDLVADEDGGHFVVRYQHVPLFCVPLKILSTEAIRIVTNRPITHM